jgi:ADP-ribose pyrophosphatase YjhB (NUDIX family)
MQKNYLNLLDEIRSIAGLGINYTQNPYDLERYNRLQQIAADNYAALTGLAPAEILERFKKELGYITPKIGVNGIFDANGQILLEQRSDDSLWGIPGGWVDMGESPEVALKREFMEEASLVIEPVEIIKIYTRLPGEFSQPHTSVHLLYFCKYSSGDIKKSHESREINFMDYTKIEHWHKDHGQYAQDAIQYLHKGILEV